MKDSEELIGCHVALVRIRETSISFGLPVKRTYLVLGGRDATSEQ
jgi:hypothetical protein